MKLLSKGKLCYKVVIILPSHTMLLISIKKVITILLLLSLFGQAVASGVMDCKMEASKQQGHSGCMQDMKLMSVDNSPHQDIFMDHDTSEDPKDCSQDCECCLGACSSSASLPSHSISLNHPSLIKTGYRSLSLINRSESLYRPPITC